MVRNTNRPYTTVQGAAHGKPGNSLCLQVLQSAVHQNPTLAADPADYTVETHPPQETGGQTGLLF